MYIGLEGFIAYQKATEKLGIGNTDTQWVDSGHVYPMEKDRPYRRGGTRKIAELPGRGCTSPSHNPPSMMVYSPGVHEHICPACGHRQVFTVNGPTW